MQDNGSPGKMETGKTPNFVGEDKPEVTRGKSRDTLGLFLLVAFLVIILDQLSKFWIDANRPQIELLPGFLDLRYTENTGAFFGLVHSHPAVFIGLGITGVIIILVFLHYFPPVTTLGVVSFALVLGGAVGNLIDRIRLGHVIDFVSLHLRDLFFWPAFNVADAALTAGILALIYYSYKSRVFGKAHEHANKPQD